MAGLLDYTDGSSVLHRLNPLTKLVLAFAVCVAAFVTGNLWYLAALLAFSLGLGFVGGIGRVALRLLWTLVRVCAFLFVLQLLFIRAGTPIWLFVTDVGVATAARVSLRLMDATMPLVLLLSVTQASDLSGALVKVARLPYRYAFTLMTALRFIPVFTGEMAHIIQAQTARGVPFDTKNPLRRVSLILPLCVPLLVSSVGRIDQAAISAEARGFYLRRRDSGYKDYPFAVRDGVALLVAAALIAAAVLVR
ncbi:MAG: energy-coupling factor transporter transmembrane protein EcfT [Actinomycetes bacterium]|jgi:energy-coupling factor transport system permease protein|nr:energy-coupling factor transporter transmembrane protein EcfT [Actinomycetes bacterium]